MGYLVAFFVCPILAYCLIQTLRDVRRRDRLMAAWGLLLIAGLLWLVWGATSGPQY